MAFPKQRPTKAMERHGAHLREVHVDPELAQSQIALELSDARRRRGGDLQAIAEELRIRYDHLLALEEGRFDDLPGPTYVIGFLRSYAGYLELDAEDMITRFKTEVSNYGAPQKLHFPAPTEEGRVPTGPLLVIALALAGASYAAWYYMTSVDRLSGGGIPEVPAQIAALAPLAEPVQPSPSTTPASSTTIANETTAPPAVVALDPASQTQPEPTIPSENAVAAVEAEEAAPGVAAQFGAMPTEEPETVALANVRAAAPQVADDVETIAAEVAPNLATEVEAATEAANPAGEAAQTTAVATANRVTGIRRPVTNTRNVRAGEVGGTVSDDIEPTVTAEVTTTAVAREPEPAVATNRFDYGPRADSAEAVPQVPPPPTAVAEYVPRVFGQGNVASRISVRAVQESWVQVTGVDNELLLTRILRPGDVYHVPDRPGLVLMTGNAGGIEIIVDGTVAPQIGPIAAVRRGVTLDADKLIAGEAAIR